MRGSAGDRAAAGADLIDHSTTRVIERAFHLRVASLALTRHRADLTVSATTPLPDADAEYRAMLAVAESLWRRAPFDSLADTVAIAVTRTARPGGAVERNTYFYYRWERRAP